MGTIFLVKVILKGMAHYISIFGVVHNLFCSEANVCKYIYEDCAFSVSMKLGRVIEHDH